MCQFRDITLQQAIWTKNDPWENVWSIPLWGHRGCYMRSTKASQAWKKRTFMVLVGMWPRSADIRGDLSIFACYLSELPFFSMGGLPVDMRWICMLAPLVTGAATPLVRFRCVNVPSPWARFLFGHCVLRYYWYRCLSPLPPIAADRDKVGHHATLAS